MTKVLPELDEALSSEKGFSLLIKGLPGTGKTILALSIIAEFPGSDALYISTRVSPNSLYKQFPWLNARSQPLNVIDATRLYISADTHFGLQTFPEALYSRLRGIGKPATIVVDSWDAMTAQVGDSKKAVLLQAAIVELVRESGINLLLVSESIDVTPLDYLVDGIAVLRKYEIDYRRAREIEIKKLRGTEISQHKYPFTLKGGRFQSFKPFERRGIEKRRRAELVPNTKTHLSTGVSDLDKIIGGGYKRGSSNIIEAGDDVSIFGYQSLIAHMIINSIQQGTNCVCIPCCGWDEKRLRRGILPFVNEEDYNKFFTVFEIGSEREKDVRENVRVLKGDLIKEDFSEFREFVSSLESPVTVIIGLDMLEYPYQLKERGKLGEMVGLLSRLMTDMRDMGNVAVFGLTLKLELGRELIHMSSTYFRLTVLHKSVVIYCNRPETKLHCLENVVTDDTLGIKLIPFV
jgi:KaiC/GvpD/RAD55 family RecA-like ATPase